MIRIRCNTKEKDLHNFWGHIVFHPTNAIEDDWGKLYLDKIAEDGAARTIRIYTAFEEIVTLDENGEMQFDFVSTDYRIDYLLSKGFDLYLVYAFIPPWLAAEQEERLIKPRYKDVIFYRSYPSDYAKWGEICRIYTQHLVDRYGEEVVAKWRMHCYNEPDWYHFFYDSAKDSHERAAAYCKLYDYFVDGVLSVSEKLQVGGPALGGSPQNFEFLEDFLLHIKETGKRLDFVSYHAYGTSPELVEDKRKPTDVRGVMFDTPILQRIVRTYGFGHLPLISDEWGAITEGYLDKTRVPEMVFRENEEYAAYFARMIVMYDEAGVPYDQIMLCLSGQHDLKGDFLGNRNFFSKNFYPKPIYNAFVLVNKLGDEKLFFYQEFDDEFLAIMPSKHSADGHMSHLFCYGDDGFTLPRPTREFVFEMADITQNYRVVKYVIDKTHANAYTKFVELGEPQDASEEMKREIREAGALKAEELGIITPTDNKVAVTMENNAVVLLELFPV